MKNKFGKKHVGLMTLSMCLMGCELAPNQASQGEITPMQNLQWMKKDTAKAQLDQGLTAFLPLYDSFMSIAARLHLINQAQHHLDLQYYIWKDDFIGNLMLSQLLMAADRGVKVRLMIDDQNGTVLDDKLIALSQHPNFEVRLFNPYKYRKLRVFDYALRLKQINHRMHNKLIVADGAVAVTGGRNISSEYFDASQDFQFSDVDIFFGGTAVQDANQTFIDFWNSDLSYDIQQLFQQQTSTEQLNQLRPILIQDIAESEKDAVRKQITLAEQLIETHLQQNPIQWARAHFVADSPNKAKGIAQNNDFIYTQMIRLMGEPKEHLELVSAYFVPTQKGTTYLTDTVDKGIKIRILTNSFMANDVPLVHAYYQQYRKELLQKGVELWEFKPYIERPERTWYERMTGNIIPAKGKNSSSLHAKFFDVDGMIFIGSFNFDPRSANLNTEVGLVIESKALQQEISQGLNDYLPKMAYQLKLDEQGQIEWLEHQSDGEIIRHHVDPETTKFQRFMMNIVPKFPAEWLM